MKLKNFMQYVWWIGVAMPLLLGCGLLVIPTPTSVPPTLTPIPPTTTPIPHSPTPISPTISPTSLPTTRVLVEQARVFAEPILQAIADRKPDFEDDFSTANKGWDWGFGMHGQEGTFAIEDGVARFRVGQAGAYIINDALNRKDFVLQLDARVVTGDPSTHLLVHFHNRSSANWYYLSMNIASLNWVVDKRLNDKQTNFVSGQGNLSPVGKMTNIIIVARGTEAAIHLNNMPVAYFNDPDFNISGYTFLFCESPVQAVCEFDNVKFWDLAMLPGLP